MVSVGGLNQNPSQSPNSKCCRWSWTACHRNWSTRFYNWRDVQKHP